jgi:hypothetical protein
MKLIIFISLLVTSLICHAEGVREVHVERRDIGEVLGKFVLPALKVFIARLHFLRKVKSQRWELLNVNQRKDSKPKFR